MPRIEGPAAVRLFTARTLSLGFLTLHAMLYLGDMVRPLPAAALFVLAVLSAYSLERTRLRFIPAALVFAGLLIALRGLMFFAFRVYGNYEPRPEADFLFFQFDSTFLPMLVPVGAAWLFTFLSRRYSSFIPWECGMSTAFFAALFWSQARFNISIYPHPAFLALAAVVLILLQAVILVETTRRRSRRFGKAGRGYRTLTWALVPLLLLFLLFMYNWYTREAVSAGGGLIKPTLFRFDFSKYIRLESEISLEDDLVMLVRKEGGNDNALLRRFILSGYRDGEGFFFEAEPGSRGFRTVVPDSPTTLGDPGYLGREEVLQEYYIVNFDPSSLISMNYPVYIAPLVNWDESSFLRIYRVESKAAGFLPLELSDCPDPATTMDPRLYEYYTTFGGDSSVRDLALEVTGGVDSYYERVVAIESYLLSNYFYSLKPGVAEDGNQLHHFLFESGKGYCSYFAFAMALMARSVGIPARVAVGFFTDPGSEIFNYFPVRADMAHAWVEVYFPDYGWINFDPTSTEIAPGEDYQFESMDMQEVSSLIEEILKNRYQLREEEGAEEEESSEVGWIRRTAEQLKRLASLWYVVVPAVYLAICVLFRLIPLLRLLAAGTGAERAKGLYRVALRTLRSLRCRRRSGETVGEYALRLDTRYGLALTPLTELYLKALFAETFTVEDVERSTAAYRDVKVSIRTSFSFPVRVLAFFNPFALGGPRP